MKKKIIPVFFLLSLLFIFSCSNEKGSLPASSGKTAEILFIIDKNHWEGILGDSIRNIFMAEYQILNQPEPLFSLAHIEESAFSKIFEPFRNIIIIEIKPEHSKAKFEVRKNVWAQPQLVFKLSANKISDLITLLSAQKEEIIKMVYENERTRMINSFKRDEDIKISNQLRDKFGFSLIIPKGYFTAKITDDFCWLRRETEETSMGILIYTYLYTDTISFNKDYILNLRDSLTKVNIPGPSEGSYMQISRKVILPVEKKLSFKNMFAVETRGLWEVEGDFMGGPFINYTFVDENKNKVITLDGFVYAPRFDKRDYVIQLESLIHTFEMKKPIL